MVRSNIVDIGSEAPSDIGPTVELEGFDMTLAAYEGNYPSPAARPSGMETLDEVAQKEPEQPQSYDHYKGNKGWTKWLGKHLIPLSVFAGGAIIGGSVTHGVYTLKARNGPAGTTSTITSENIAVSPPTTNPGLITLNEDGGITISGSVKLPADIQVGSLNSGEAIILNDGAVLDCNGHSITGDLSHEVSGIVVEGGATKVINCPAVTSFGKNGAFLYGKARKDVTIEKSSFSENGQYGILGDNYGYGTLEMIDVTAMDNEFDGIALSGWDEITLENIISSKNGYGGLVYADEGSLNVTIEKSSFSENGQYGILGDNYGYGTLEMIDVTAMDNEFDGIALSGWDEITLENIISSKNGYGGLAYSTYGAGSLILNEVACADNKLDGLTLLAEGGPLDVVLDGKNSFHNNSQHGIGIRVIGSSVLTTVSVDGKTAVNDNREGGILFEEPDSGGSGSVDFEVVKKKGSLTTCGNSNFDWDTGNYVSTFTGPGKYVCGTATGNDVPTCNPCKDEKSRKLGLGN
eukprot:scaffold15786_cov259-Skeletonema_menzelii.AAC.2